MGRVHGVPIRPIARASLRADCGACAGLCCVALTLAKSADFALDKPAGEPCPHLGTDFRCAIHPHLVDRGFPGCVAYDCFGAGQQAVRTTGIRDWRADPDARAALFATFGVLETLGELLWYLAEAHDLTAGHPLHGEVGAAWDATLRLAAATPPTTSAADVATHRATVATHRATVATLLGRVSESVRVPARSRTPRRAGPRADLIGADLRRADLRGADLRGALLLGADLRGADLASADLLGAALRAARLAGAALSRALFLSRRQVSAARGDGTTRLPPWLEHPGHWR